MTDDTKAKLRELRDRLAFELPRARVRATVTGEIVQRMQAALDAVNAAFAMPPASTASAEEALEEARQEAVVEAHVALHDWERWLEAQRPSKLKAQPPTSRRAASARTVPVVAVKFLSYRAQNGDGRDVAVASDEPARSARNVSADGMFVTLAKNELPQIAVGGLVQVATTVDTAVLQTRATVVRRDADGIALRWNVDTDRTRRTVEAILAAVRRSRKSSS